MSFSSRNLRKPLRFKRFQVQDDFLLQFDSKNLLISYIIAFFDCQSDLWAQRPSHTVTLETH